MGSRLRRCHRPLLLALALTLVGCATTLEPAPEATRIPGRFKAAAAEVAGVRVVATAGAWRGFPRNLDDAVIPILMTIENGSQHAVGLRYTSFALETPAGVRFAALPPLQITERVTEPVRASFHPRTRFSVGSSVSAYDWGWSAYDGPLAFDPWYYDRHALWLRRAPTYWIVQLPTSDMIRTALPEGVVQPRGAVSGFVYFEELRDDPRSVILSVRIVDATSGEELGVGRIPFVVD